MTEIETHLFASSIKLTRLGLGQMKYKVKKANIEMMKVHICIDIVNNMHVNSFRIIGSKGNIRAVIAKEKNPNFKDKIQDGYFSLVYHRGIVHGMKYSSTLRNHVMSTSTISKQFILPDGYIQCLVLEDRYIIYKHENSILVIDMNSITVDSLNDMTRLPYTIFGIGDLMANHVEYRPQLMPIMNNNVILDVIRVMHVRLPDHYNALVAINTRGDRYECRSEFLGKHCSPSIYKVGKLVVVAQFIIRNVAANNEEIGFCFDQQHTRLHLLNGKLRRRDIHTSSYNSDYSLGVSKMSILRHTAFAINKNDSIAIVVCMRSKMINIGHIRLLNTLNMTAGKYQYRGQSMFAVKSSILLSIDDNTDDNDTIIHINI